jgi:predicted GNAT family acetyltransferase
LRKPRRISSLEETSQDITSIDSTQRGRGLSTSAVSALVNELISLGKEPVLWVAEDNYSVKHIYEKIGFEKAEHTLLGFKTREP